MKASIFTATFNPCWLYRLYKSIIAQTYSNWEWIVLLNNLDKKHDFSYISDDRVKVIDSNITTDSIGLVKKEAALQCCGDILIDVDHDDFLRCDCIEKLVCEIQDYDFIFSDYCLITSKEQGIDLKNTDALKTEQFKYKQRYYYHIHYLQPEILPKIFHIKAWKKNFYYAIGGYNEHYKIGEDLDIVLRTHLNGRIKHLEECLYFYRMTDNTTKKRIFEYNYIKPTHLILHNLINNFHK